MTPAASIFAALFLTSVSVAVLMYLRYRDERIAVEENSKRLFNVNAENSRLRVAWQTAPDAESSIAADRDRERDRADKAEAELVAERTKNEVLAAELLRAHRTVALLKECERGRDATIEAQRCG